MSWYPAATGKFLPVRNADDWALRRSAVIAGFEEAAGKLPSRESLPAFDLKVHEEVEEEKFVKQRISFVAEEGDRITALFYLPKGKSSAGRRAGIVALHPTHKIGKDVVDGLSERPNRGYARELAGLGFVVVAPDYPSFGEQMDYDFSADRYESGAMKAVWNHMRCVDLLVSRDEVDAERIGAIGHSLGGHNAIFLGVFDERVKALVSSCGWTPFRDYKGGNISGWTSERYFPSLRDRYELNPDRVPFDFYGLVAALAPRAFFSNSPLHDSNFDYRGVEKAAPKVRRVYELFDAADNLRIAYPNAEHDFPRAVREESFEFLHSHLGKGD
ncbi:alpha/beta fold hydrolase [Verrucomicrobiales bacterium BCK34]|nr:alpha/beta fold hydrolase [Verrucomicrobiales bacterium BCK34]